MNLFIMTFPRMKRLWVCVLGKLVFFSLCLLWLGITMYLQSWESLLPYSPSPSESNRVALAVMQQFDDDNDHVLDHDHDHDHLLVRNAKVRWLKFPEININEDMFSATWLMNKQMFLESPRPLEKIIHVEGACFAMFRSRPEKVRMALDWLDLAVEHMSTWWKIVLDIETHRTFNTKNAKKDNNKTQTLNIQEGRDYYAYALDRVVSILDNYRLKQTATLQRGGDKSSPPYGNYYDKSILRPTIALIAFQPYKLIRKKIDIDDNNDKTKVVFSSYYSNDQDRIHQGGIRLTVASLSATIASLMQVGIGRIVVVGHQESDEQVVRQAFDLFVDSNSTQLAYARVTDGMVHSEFNPINIPKAALLGLRQAMIGNNSDWTRMWLGEEDPNQWKYVYLTEPDTILNTRPSSLRSIEKALKGGLILVPHRLQLMPYQGDFPDSPVLESFVPLQFKSPVTLDASLVGSPRRRREEEDACCDEQAGSYKPGKHPFMKRCGNNFWWRCGFLWTRRDENHSRLEHYDFIRLEQGTGVVTLAGTPHGRRCFSQKSNKQQGNGGGGDRSSGGRCQRKMSVNHPHHPQNPWQKQHTIQLNIK